jgi:predicted lipid carrier protein YhbT
MSTTKESNDSKGSTNKSKSFPILYKKNDADTIFFWKTIVLNNNEEVYLITEHGVNEGKVKKSKRKVTKAGRATNLFEKGIKTAM